MPVVIPLAVAAISAGGAAVAANQKKVANNKATDAANVALNAQKPQDPQALADQAYQQDLAKYKADFAAQQAVDPQTAQMRTAANTGLLANANGSDANSTNANTLLQNLFDANNPVNPTDVNFENTLKAKAQGLLDLGGQLSPDAQAEFVRAGLEKTGQSGFNPASGATVNGVGNLLFTQSNALEQQRAAMAKDLFGFATDLNTTRNNQLLNIAGASSGKSVSDYQKLMGIAQLSDSRVPSLGLTGPDVAGISAGNVTQANNVALQRGGVAAANAQAAGQIAAGLTGGITSAITGAIGGGLLGGGGSLLSGVGSSVTTPATASNIAGGLTFGNGLSPSSIGSLSTPGYSLGNTCYVARAVYGEDDPAWLFFREAMIEKMPRSFVEFYKEHGPELAERVARDDDLKTLIRGFMDYVRSTA